MENQNKNSDKSLKTGERSIGKTIYHCTKDQLWRYVEALNDIGKNDNVLDLGCGCGYGSFILANKANTVVGIDDSKETIDYANTYYKKQNIKYCCKDVFEIKEQYDDVVALEIIEHIKNTDKLFEKLSNIVKKRLIISVPEESAINNNKFHWKHYSVEELKEHIEKINFVIKKLLVIRFAGGYALYCVAEKKEQV